ncbi:MAG: hypothetical protein K2X08_06125 [Chlamydiales bacterium]|nr:hypothetical protein [Chlamydiales bacterium]
MRFQKLVTIIASAVTFSVFAPINALDAQDTDKQLTSKGGPSKPYHSKKMREKCHGLSKDMYEFGSLLNESNQKMFCAKFTDEQRKKAMQMASKKGWTGNPKMTPDQAVEKVARELSSNTDKHGQQQ